MDAAISIKYNELGTVGHRGSPQNFGLTRPTPTYATRMCKEALHEARFCIFAVIPAKAGIHTAYPNTNAVGGSASMQRRCTRRDSMSGYAFG